MKNYLELIPVKNPSAKYKKDKTGLITIEIKNKGAANFICRKLMKKPATTYVHLDKIGSFVFGESDGEKNIMQIGQIVKEKFGPLADPLYERLTEYIKILVRNGFLQCKK